MERKDAQKWSPEGSKGRKGRKGGKGKKGRQLQMSRYSYGKLHHVSMHIQEHMIYVILYVCICVLT